MALSYQNLFLHTQRSSHLVKAIRLVSPIRSLRFTLSRSILSRVHLLIISMDIQNILLRKEECILLQDELSKYVTNMKGRRPKTFLELRKRILAVLNRLAAVAVDFQIAVGHIDADILKLTENLDKVNISPSYKKITPATLYDELSTVATRYYTQFV